MTSAAVREKIKRAVQAAQGRTFDSEADLDRFLNEDLAWPIANTYGGNTACIEVNAGGGEYILCDLGSGVREFGVKMMVEHGPAKPQTYHVFLSHLHWDHIMGFPFFPPAFIPGNTINIYSCHPDPEASFRKQQSEPNFPVDFSVLGADIQFVPLTPGEPVSAGGATVTAKLQNHAGDSYGYRFESGGRSFVYATDSEHKQENADETQAVVAFFRDADLVAFDAQYSLAEAVSLKEDWGHSSNVIGVELCLEARVKHLLMIHHEPVLGDEALYRILEETLRYEELMRPEGAAPLRISSAFDGMVLSLPEESDR
jgi:phosphoribosyl 1,2-cyclic phosphodiesterase